jgi:osmotically-inducible protein OsmY
MQSINSIESDSMRINIANKNNPDDMLIAEVAEQFLEWSPAVPLEGLTLSVLDGWLTISGTVSWLSQKREAARAVQWVPGLVGFSDHVDIRNLE